MKLKGLKLAGILIMLTIILLSNNQLAQLNQLGVLKVDRTVLTVVSASENIEVELKGLFCGSPFENSELNIKNQKTPFEIELSPGNYLGVIQTSNSDDSIKVKINEYYEGELALTAENSGKRILIRSVNNWAAIEQLN
jgi:hypothetical protein